MEVTLPISPLKPEESGHMLVVEGEGAAEEGVKNDSAGPDIHLGTRVQLARYYLGKERRDVPMAKKTSNPRSDRRSKRQQEFNHKSKFHRKNSDNKWRQNP